jgi:5-methylcytosine-specific restriction endonuclease McrA
MKKSKKRFIELEKRRKQSWKSIRKSMKCQWCGSKKHLTIDHIVPKSNNGKNNLSNLRVLCRSCHNKRHKIDKLSWYGK